MKNSLLFAAGLLVASLVFAAKIDGKRVERIVTHGKADMIYVDCTVHEARERYIHFTVNGGTQWGKEVDRSWAGKEVVFSGEYEIDVAKPR